VANRATDFSTAYFTFRANDSARNHVRFRKEKTPVRSVEPRTGAKLTTQRQRD
jgi:hypothetical protein